MEQVVPKYNAAIQRRNGRPLAASEAQVEQGLKAAQARLRGIAEETSLGLATVCTIIDKSDGRDRTSIKHLQRIDPDGELEAVMASAGAQEHRAPQAHQRRVAPIGEAGTGFQMMRPIVAIMIALLPSFALAQPLPQPKPPGPGGSCPHGYTSSGSFCVPSQGAQDAIPLPANGTCPHGWTRSGSFCLRSGSGR